ncbi:unnamed protein product [Danaus chrysippus]|uniref:(African queen) hypothetical protein n=1 Tax=Danaus chrysippus TaxID=151541 RepID=A0A8J2QYW5_9NEOP|nr:unnamed protein product [Danaus chrysippus]
MLYNLLEWSWKVPPSWRRTFANSTADTNGTSVSSSRQHCTPNLYLFFLDMVMNAMTPPPSVDSQPTSLHFTSLHFTCVSLGPPRAGLRGRRAVLGAPGRRWCVCEEAGSEHGHIGGRLGFKDVIKAVIIFGECNQTLAIIISSGDLRVPLASCFVSSRVTAAPRIEHTARPDVLSLSVQSTLHNSTCPHHTITDKSLLALTFSGSLSLESVSHEHFNHPDAVGSLTRTTRSSAARLPTTLPSPSLHTPRYKRSFYSFHSTTFSLRKVDALVVNTFSNK